MKLLQPAELGRASLCCFCMLQGIAAIPAAAQSTITGTDYFGPIVEWQHSSGIDVAPIHGGLLPNGKLYFLTVYKFFKYPEQDMTEPGFTPEYMFLMDPTPYYEVPPATVTVTPNVSTLPASPVYDALTNSVTIQTLTCGAHAPMADGNLFLASGATAVVNLDLYNAGDLAASVTVDGLEKSLTYNPIGDNWTENPDVTAIAPNTGKPLRWYATVTRMADSKMLVTGGYESVVPDMLYNNSVEIYDPVTNSWSIVSDQETTPEGIENPDYTHVFQFPYDYDPGDGSGPYNVTFMLGGSGEPLYLAHNDASSFWYRTGNYRPGALEFIEEKAPKKVFPGHGSSSTLLPLRLPEDSWGYANGSVMVAGGAHFTPMEENIDIFDVGTNTWLPSIPMGTLRHHTSTVMLPDGRILILGGHDDVNGNGETGYAQYLDPKNGFELRRGLDKMSEIRGYHAVTVLLPDGRVLIGGGNPGGTDGEELTNFRYYYPDYMFLTRPELIHVGETINYASPNFLFVPHATSVDDAALVGLASMTHSYDMNQRHVQLRTTDLNVSFKLEADGSWSIGSSAACQEAESTCLDVHMVEGPENEEFAPPGHYTLFILDENRVPSIGKIVKLEQP